MGPRGQRRMAPRVHNAIIPCRRLRPNHSPDTITTLRNDMKAIKSGILIAAAASALALGACDMAKDGAKSADGASKGPTAATVNGTAISQQTVDNIVRQAAAQGRPDTPETRKAIIDQLPLQGGG